MALSRTWKKRFLDTLRETSNIRLACHTAAVARSWAYEKREKDPKFAAQWDEAIEEATDILEGVARKRATNGVERRKQIYFKEKNAKGEQETVRMNEIVEQEYSDTLLIFLLKAHRPEKYQDTLKLLIDCPSDEELDQMSDEELDQYEAKIERRIRKGSR